MKRLLFALALALPLAAAERADLLITGGTIVTMAGPNIERGSIVIRGGEIIDVGPSAEVDGRYHAKEVIRAGGHAVTPGFVNAHTHAPMVLFRGIADDRDPMDWLTNYIFPAEAKNVDRDFVKWGMRLAAAEMIRSGTTTFADMYYFEADIAREAKAAGLRGVLANTFIDFPAPDNKTWDATSRSSTRTIASSRPRSRRTRRTPSPPITSSRSARWRRSSARRSSSTSPKRRTSCARSPRSTTA